MIKISFAHLGTYEDILVANNTDLNDRSTTSLAGTKNLSSEVPFPALGNYHVDLDLSVLSVSTCCALKHFFASIQCQTFIPRHQWRYF